MIRLLAFVGLFSCHLVMAQDSAQVTLGFSTTYHPQDFFFSLHTSISKKQLIHTFDAGFGTIKTIFQTRFYPRLSYEFGGNLKLTPWLKIQPGVRMSYSNLNLRVPAKHPFIHTGELFAVGRFVMGKKHAAIVGGGLGPAVEFKWNVSRQKTTGFWLWNYFVELGYRYAF